MTTQGLGHDPSPDQRPAHQRPSRMGALIVDDEADVRLLVRLRIEERNEGLYVVGEASDGLTALELIDEADPDIVVLDQMMPGMDGLETASRILARRPTQKIVLFSAFLDAEVRAQAAEQGITRCLGKDQLKELPDLLHELAAAA